MQRDILHRRIKQYYSSHEKHYFGKYYIYNNNIYRVVRLRCINKFKTPFYIMSIKHGLGSKDILLSDFYFNKMKFYDNKPNISPRKNNRYNKCYFENSKMKKNFHVLEKLYELGYKNYSRMTAIGFHQCDYSIIDKKGLILTTHQSEDELKSEGYRNLFDYYKAK